MFNFSCFFKEKMNMPTSTMTLTHESQIHDKLIAFKCVFSLVHFEYRITCQLPERVFGI